MTEQIKFRGFRVDNDKPVYGDLLQINGECYIYPNEFGDLQDTDFGYSFIEVYISSIGMFTGLYDKNGREIYGAIGERGGDVVSTPKGIAPVTFEFGCCYVITVSRYRLGGWNSDAIEIIGNQFHQNNGKV